MVDQGLYGMDSYHGFPSSSRHPLPQEHTEIRSDDPPPRYAVAGVSASSAVTDAEPKKLQIALRSDWGTTANKNSWGATSFTASDDREHLLPRRPAPVATRRGADSAEINEYGNWNTTNKNSWDATRFTALDDREHLLSRHPASVATRRGPDTAEINEYVDSPPAPNTTGNFDSTEEQEPEEQNKSVKFENICCSLLVLIILGLGVAYCVMSLYELFH